VEVQTVQNDYCFASAVMRKQIISQSNYLQLLARFIKVLVYLYKQCKADQ